MPHPKAQHQNEHNAHNKRLLASRQLKHERHDKPKNRGCKTRDVLNFSVWKKWG
jgi:hypothetical protein